MKLRIVNLILTFVMSLTCLGLLIYVGYSWYVSSSQVTAENISFSSMEGADVGYEVTVLGSDGKIISAPVIPDEITMLTIELKDTSAKTINVSMTPKLSFKDVTYTDSTNKLINTITTVVEDPTNQSSSISKVMNAEEFMKYYLVDEYYKYETDGNSITKGDKLYDLTDAQKLEIFSSFYGKYTYSLINKLKYYVSDTLYTSDQYKTNLIDNIATSFTNLSEGLSFDIDITLQPDSTYVGKRYIYFYFDPTDEIFPYGLSSTDANYNSALANYCFYGQNPYFYQTISFDVLTTSS